MEAFEQQVARRRHGAARPAIGEERIDTAVRLERRVGLRKDEDATQGRIDGRHQQG
jgi:hypothetical protein